MTSVYCSAEQKAIAGAEILAGHLGTGFEQVEELGENDRSATGFLPPSEFERVADEFCGANARIVRAVQGIFMVARNRYLSSRARRST